MLPPPVHVMSGKRAKLIDLCPKKGMPRPGLDADLILFDPTEAYMIAASTWHARCDKTLCGGRHSLGLPVTKRPRGKTLLDNGEVKATAGQGRFSQATPRNWWALADDLRRQCG